MTSDDQLQTFPFFALPRELRDQVYTLLFTENSDTSCTITAPSKNGDDNDNNDDENSNNNINYGPSIALDLKFLHPLCQASTQLYYEATPLLLRSYGAIIFGDRNAIEFPLHWLSSFTEKIIPSPSISAFIGIKDLRIPWYAGWDPAHFRLLKRLVNLQTLELGLEIRQEDRAVFFEHQSKIAQMPTKETESRKKELEVVVQHFVKQHHLSIIVDRLDKLSHFTFYLLTWSEETNDLGFALRAWFDEWWKQRGRDVWLRFIEEDKSECCGFIIVD